MVLNTCVSATQSSDNSKIDQINIFLKLKTEKPVDLQINLILDLSSKLTSKTSVALVSLLVTEITVHIDLAFILFLFIWTCACLMYSSCRSSHLENLYELSKISEKS